MASLRAVGRAYHTLLAGADTHEVCRCLPHFPVIRPVLQNGFHLLRPFPGNETVKNLHLGGEMFYLPVLPGGKVQPLLKF